MTSARHQELDELRICSSFGCISFVWFLFGTVVTACVFIPAEVRGGDEFPWYIGLPVGFGLIAAGTYRRIIVLNSASRAARVRRAVCGITVSQSERSLQSCDRVVIAPRVRRSDAQRHTVYIVALSGPSSLELEEHSYARNARTSAIRVAEFMDLPLHDASSGKVHIREPETLRVPMQDRASLGGRRLVLPDAPRNMRTRIDLSDGVTATLAIPPRGWSATTLLSTLPTCAFGVFLIWIVHDAFTSELDIGEFVIAVVGLVVGCICLVGLPLFVIVGFVQRERVSVSPDELSVSVRSFFGMRTRKIQASAIDEVLVRQVPTHASGAQQGGIVVRSDQRTIEFGKHLNETEKEYLSQFIRAVVAG